MLRCDIAVEAALPGARAAARATSSGKVTLRLAGLLGTAAIRIEP